MLWVNDFLLKIPWHSRSDWLIPKDNNRSRGGDLVTMTLTPNCPPDVLVQESHMFLTCAGSALLWSAQSKRCCWACGKSFPSFIPIDLSLHLYFISLALPKSRYLSSFPFCHYPPFPSPSPAVSWVFQMLASQEMTDSHNGTSSGTNPLAKLWSDATNENLRKAGLKVKKYWVKNTF